MLPGERIRLRLVNETDLDVMYAFHQDVSNRGDFYPLGVVSRPAFGEQYQTSGFWQDKEGTLVIVDGDGSIVGHIEFFQTVSYLDEFELSYLVYNPDHAGQGIATEAVSLLSGYLFDQKKINRIRLIIHPDNTASRRVAEKTGFRFEGVARGAWYHRGRNHDVEVWSLLRGEHRPLTRA